MCYICYIEFKKKKKKKKLQINFIHQKEKRKKVRVATVTSVMLQQEAGSLVTQQEAPGSPDREAKLNNHYNDVPSGPPN